MYRDYSFSEKDIETYAALIPECYYAPLLEGKLLGKVIVEDDLDVEEVVGIALYRIIQGYIEVKWIATTPDYDLPDYGADIVRRLLNKARIHGGCRGIYSRYRKGSLMSRYFQDEDFTYTTELGGVYRFRLRDVKMLDKDHDSKRISHCVPLGKADSQLKNMIIASAEESHDAIPLSQPVQWEKYDQEMSFIYKLNDTAEGAILVEANDDELVISLLYSKDPLAAIVLLKHAFHVAYEKYGPDCMVACPVITKISEDLVKKIVRKVDRVEVIRAQVDLPVGTGSLADFLHYTGHRKEHVTENGSAE